MLFNHNSPGKLSQGDVQCPGLNCPGVLAGPGVAGDANFGRAPVEHWM